MKPAGLEIRRENLDSGVAAELIGELNAELTALYPEEGATHFRLDREEVSEGRGAFLVATQDGKPVGCGAIRRIDPSTAEIKRMYVAKATRGLGVGRALLDALELEAENLGVSRIVLETGTRQLAALALYSSAGFVRIALFGEYVGTSTSVCMEKPIRSRGPG